MKGAFFERQLRSHAREFPRKLLTGSDRPSSAGVGPPRSFLRLAIVGSKACFGPKPKHALARFDRSKQTEAALQFRSFRLF